MAASQSDDDHLASSNYGACNDLFAPGSAITSAGNASDDATATGDGTSMAAPHVAGAAARVLQTTPSATPAQVWATINAAATAGVLTNLGTDDPNKLLYLAPSSSASPITDYVVEYRVVGAGSWSMFVDGVSTATGATVTGLVNGTSYEFRVAAVNSTGTGPGSAASSPVAPVSPGTVPGAPRTVTGVAGNAQVAVSWLVPLSAGTSPINAYLVTASPGGATCSTAGALSCAVTGLANGTGYTFTVRASNVAGPGPDSSTSSSVTPRTVPGAPTITTASGGGSGSATVSWSAGSTGGSPVVDFDIEYSTTPGFAAGTGTFVESGTSSALSQIVSGLPIDTVHHFRVRASNAAGDSPWSAPISDATTPCSPGSFSATGLVPCTTSPPGSYVTTTGAVAATPCAVGTYQPSQGQTGCLPAPVNHFVSTTGAVGPTPCAVGTRQPATGQVACIPHGLDVSDPTIAFEPQTSTRIYAVFTVKLSKVYTTTVKVKASTVNGSAVSRRDYTALTTTLTFKPGETTKTVKVRILGDDVLEAQEGFTLVLSKPVGAPIVDGSGAGVVAADPSLPVVSVSDAASVNEPTGSASVFAVFTVTLSKSFAKTVTVKVTAVGGTATKGKDFSSFSATVTLTAGVTTKTVRASVRCWRPSHLNYFLSKCLEFVPRARVAPVDGG